MNIAKYISVGVAAGMAVNVVAENAHRDWAVSEGYVNEATSWKDSILPTQGSDKASGETAYFTGSGNKTVKFPAGGWTDTGMYYFARNLNNGTSITFDATDTSWTFGAGQYLNDWQVFTLCGTSAGVAIPICCR